MIKRKNMKELIMIQQELHAPKNQRNNFGGYNYRSCEDILLAVKPLLEKYECVLLLSDEVKELAHHYHIEQQSKDGQMSYDGTRVYIEATAMLINKEGQTISVKGIAREEVTKKGMDASQITGATSSYARKYALNGLFCIDDNKDADATNTHGKDLPNGTTSTGGKGGRVSKSEAKKAPTPAPAPQATPFDVQGVKLKICGITSYEEGIAIYKATPKEYQAEVKQFVCDQFDILGIPHK
jgi:hypothetical protein